MTMGGNAVKRTFTYTRLAIALTLALVLYFLLLPAPIQYRYKIPRPGLGGFNDIEQLDSNTPKVQIESSGLEPAEPNDEIVGNETPLAQEEQNSSTPSMSTSSINGPPLATEKRPAESTLAATPSPLVQGPPCWNLPGASDVLLVLKTGASEIYEKLPAHFVTTFLCAPDYLIYSDLEQDIGPYHVIDALANVSDEVKNNHKDFELYRTQVKLVEEGQDISVFKGDLGWALDKWKFVPMLTDAGRRFPEKKWFVFMEADTLLSWANLLKWLTKLDPSNPLYIGCQVVIGETVFAHGGSGFVISQPAVKKVIDMEGERKKIWEERTSKDCCGDKVIADALLDGGVGIKGGFPMIQGLTPTTLDWSPPHWCSPVISWHHMSANEIDTVWQLEQAWIDEKGPQESLLFSHVYEALVQPYMQENRSEWDNLSNDHKITLEAPGGSDFFSGFGALSETAQQGHASLDACRIACIDVSECLQYAWSPGQCRLGRFIRLGKVAKKGLGQAQEDVYSGWLFDRMEEWMKHQTCTNGGRWITEDGNEWDYGTPI